MSWYHEVCVGIKKGDPIGIWLCFTCRTVPKNTRNGISSLKNDVIQLKTTTDLILSSVNKLSTQLENCVGGINDRIMALTRQVNLHDISMSEAIENVSTKTSNLKTAVDQKTNTLVNKTTAVYEKIKNHENNLKNSKNCGADKTQTTQNKESTQTQETIKPKRLGSSTKRTKTDTEHLDKHQGRQKKQGKEQQQQKPVKHIDEDEIIDLTKQHSSGNTIKKVNASNRKFYFEKHKNE